MLEENSIFATRYQIVRRLASGGMGAVYEARHLETGRACALKIMLTHVAENSPSRERFRLEARAAALVSSAHVVEVLDAGVNEATGSPYLVMELLRGEDLASRLERLGRLPAEDVAKFIFQAALGLDALHRAAIVHRDLKPSNLFLAKRDNAEIIKVLDLGVAKRVMDTAVTTAVVGTPLYMAPEQIQASADVDGRADIYALGVMTYQMLTGRLPFERPDTGAILLAHLNSPPPDAREVIQDLPRPAARAVQKAMAKNLHERFSSAKEFVAELENAQAIS